ncbi:hypothetical protein ACLB2K_075933 [Fragaria x ananassa]
MLKTLATFSTTTPLLSTTTATTTKLSLSSPFFSLSKFQPKPTSPFPQTRRPISLHTPTMNILNRLGFGPKTPDPNSDSAAIAQGPDDDVPAPGQQFAQFGAGHDPTTLNRQGGDVGTQYRSGIYFYTPEQEQAAKESMEKHQKVVNRPIVTEILPAKKFYRAEEYHQQYLAKGGRFGFRQSAEKGCNDPIRCYG